MAEVTSPQFHMERLVPLLMIVTHQRPASAFGGSTTMCGDRHLHDCPVDALRCILFDACTVRLSLRLIIEPREGLSEPTQVYLWRQHQSTLGCCYNRLPHVAPGCENYVVSLPSLRVTAKVAAVCRRWGCIIGAWASRRRNPTHSVLEVVVEVPAQSRSTEHAGSRKLRHCQILKTTILVVKDR